MEAPSKPSVIVPPNANGDAATETNNATVIVSLLDSTVMFFMFSSVVC